MPSPTPGQVVTRFAPSPTGHLHVGGARTALFNWAYARHFGGKFLLRIEDTDQVRSSESAERAILDDLAWLGLDWDNMGAEPRQSRRLDLYNAALAKLIDAGRAYEDDGAVRFRMPDHDIVVIDEVLGEVRIPAGQTEDFVIRKRDGFPTYHFAVVVDDFDMGVTHVIRGQEHLSNSPKHVALQQALGYPSPKYAHIPLIFNPDGSKMSKRDKAKAARAAAQAGGLKSPRLDPSALNAFMNKESDDIEIALAIAKELNLALPEIDVADFQKSGYLPQVLCNYLALLGWNPGNDIEKFDNVFLSEHFDFDRVGKKNARFDREKLISFNADTIRAMSVNEFAAAWRAWCETYRPDFAAALDAAAFVKLAGAYHERTRVFSEACDMAAFFVAEAISDFDPKAVEKNLLKGDGEGLTLLKAFREELAALSPFNGAAAHELIKTFCETRVLGMGKVAQPLRVALSGSAVTPPMDLTLDILGQKKTLDRIDACLAKFSGEAAGKPAR
ncbi:MAG: hypothetical protein GC162_08055 [Planctomycetes bacterium]|nr:hypothetical protein [Planctomycetota bacterium]